MPESARATQGWTKQQELWVDAGGIIQVPANDGIRTFLLEEAHDQITSGHGGIEKTLQRLKEKWFWTGMRADVGRYVSTCVKCQKVRANNRKAAGLLHPILANDVGDIVTLDFMSKFVSARGTGYQQCLIIVDKFSRFVCLQGCSISIDAQETARLFLARVLPIFGVLRKVISDRGPQFTASFWDEMLRLQGAKKALATAHHPQTDGQSERAVQTLIKLLRTYSTDQQADWEMLLPYLEMAINSMPNESTKVAPSEVVLGRIPRLPFDFAISHRDDKRTESQHDLTAHEDSHSRSFPTDENVKNLQHRLKDIRLMVFNHQVTASSRSQRFFNKGRKAEVFEPGDWVMLDTRSYSLNPQERKQTERFTGPYVVRRKIHTNAYELSGLPPNLPKVQNVQFLRKFKESMDCFDSRPETPYARPEVTEDKEVEWEVSAIMDSRGTGRKKR